MNHITLESKVGSDGVLHLDLPVGIDNADQAVRVTIEPVSPSSLSQEEWRRRILATAGKWQGDLERPE